ncbi:MAG: hypothetical protein HY619_06995 [Thaumarchaeota archaeon]|nr:hypothetical protein [Nitrososphaerota archaeon]
MAKTEQIVTDRKTMTAIIKFMEEAVKEGLNREEIMSQIDLILDREAREKIKQSQREIKQGKGKSFKSAEEAIEWLHSEEE